MLENYIQKRAGALRKRERVMKCRVMTVEGRKGEEVPSVKHCFGLTP